jgi:Tetracyclin repressor-like, C-terminal domain
MSRSPSASEARATGQFRVEDVLSYSSRWDKRIATDLIAEMEGLFADKPATLPEMRHILAVKGYRGLKRRIEIDVEGRTGSEAVRALANAMRDFALEHPGLSAATFRNPASDSPEWQRAGADLKQVAFEAFSQVGLKDDHAAQALHILRSLVRGFVISEMAASFFVDPLEYQQTFDRGIDVFIRGLPALGGP